MPAPSKTDRLQLFNQLQGTWQLERRWGMQGHMQGTARFQPWAQDILHYQEQGSAVFDNTKRVNAHRAYAYVYSQGEVAVHFWDQQRERPGALLHTLQFSPTETFNQHIAATALHHCAPDRYEAYYAFLSPQQFQLTYWVKGPRKDDVIQTYFDKVEETSA